MLNRGSLRPEISFIEDLLNNGLMVRVRVTGKSMSPFLQGNEILTIRKTEASALRTGDLIFFRSREGLPVLHRIIKKRTSDKGLLFFYTKGDALFAFDEPITGEAVIGKVCAIKKLASDTEMRHINMESHAWRVINFVKALTGLGKSQLYFAGSKCISFLPSRSEIKKTFL
jgi:signal peptidase I